MNWYELIWIVNILLCCNVAFSISAFSFQLAAAQISATFDICAMSDKPVLARQQTIRQTGNSAGVIDSPGLILFFGGRFQFLIIFHHFSYEIIWIHVASCGIMWHCLGWSSLEATTGWMTRSSEPWKELWSAWRNAKSQCLRHGVVEFLLECNVCSTLQGFLFQHLPANCVIWCFVEVWPNYFDVIKTNPDAFVKKKKPKLGKKDSKAESEADAGHVCHTPYEVPPVKSRRAMMCILWVMMVMNHFIVLYCVPMGLMTHTRSCPNMPKSSQIHSQSIDSHRMFLQAQAWSRCRMELLHNKAWQGWWELANGLWMVMNGAADSSHLLCMIGFFLLCWMMAGCVFKFFQGMGGMDVFLSAGIAQHVVKAERTESPERFSGWKLKGLLQVNMVQWCSMMFNMFQFISILFQYILLKCFPCFHIFQYNFI